MAAAALPNVSKPPSSFPEVAQQVIPMQRHLIYPSSAETQPQTTFDPTGKYSLMFEGGFSAVNVSLAECDGLKSQGGMMISISDNVHVDTRMHGALELTLAQLCCAWTSTSICHFSLLPNKGPRGDVLLAPPVPGEVILLPMDGSISWVMQPSSFTACDDSIALETKVLDRVQVVQACCGGAGAFNLLEATGQGRLLVCSYGAITRYDLAPGERRKIDNGYCMAWTSGMQWSIGKVTESLVKNFIAGESLVANFTGPGTVFVQTRSLASLAHTLVPFLPKLGIAASGRGGGNTHSS